MDDGDAAADAGMLTPVDGFAGLPNWVSAVVLPVPAGPDRIRPRRALIA
ncbi:hypothetical protein ABZ202_28460 [Streptomyces sp. NPDC006186]